MLLLRAFWCHISVPFWLPVSPIPSSRAFVSRIYILGWTGFLIESFCLYGPVYTTDCLLNMNPGSIAEFAPGYTQYGLNMAPIPWQTATKLSLFLCCIHRNSLTVLPHKPVLLLSRFTWRTSQGALHHLLQKALSILSTLFSVHQQCLLHN